MTLVAQRRSRRPSLRRTWSRIRTVPGLGRDSSALAVVIILGLITVFVILSGEGTQFPWSSAEPHYQLTFSDAVAVSPGSGQQVRIAGVPEGKIVKSTPTRNGEASIVTIALKRGHPLYTNASAVLTPINPLNEMYIELDPGGRPAKLLGKGQAIPATQTQSPVQADSVLDHLTGNVRQAVTTLIDTSASALATSSTSLGPGLTSTDRVLKQLTPVAENLQARRQKIQALATALSEISGAVGGNDSQLAGLINSTQQTLDILDTHDDQVSATLAELPGFTGSLRNAMAQTSTFSSQLNPVLANLSTSSRDLPGTLDALTTTADKLGPVVSAARPVVAGAGPIVTQLRPIVTNVHQTLNHTTPLTACLPQAVGKIAPWMYDLGAFIDNSLGIWHSGDQNGIAAQATFAVDVNNPYTSYVGTTETTTGTYQQGGSPLGPYQPPGPSC